MAYTKFKGYKLWTDFELKMSVIKPFKNANAINLRVNGISISSKGTVMILFFQVCVPAV
jgi:hypothetical protein